MQFRYAALIFRQIAVKVLFFHWNDRDLLQISTYTLYKKSQTKGPLFLSYDPKHQGKFWGLKNSIFQGEIRQFQKSRVLSSQYRKQYSNRLKFFVEECCHPTTQILGNKTTDPKQTARLLSEI